MNPTKINRSKILEKLQTKNKIQQVTDKNLEKNNDIIADNNIKHSNNLKLSDVNKARLPILDECNNSDCKNYIYKLNSVLNTSDIPDFKSDGLIHICIFQVCYNNVNHPFLLYLLNKDKNNNKLYFPHFTASKNILATSKKYINEIFNDWKITPIFKGHINSNNNKYLFFEINYEYIAHKLTYKDSWWWTSLFEIVNINTVLNFNIHNTVSSIFNKYPLLISLFNNKNNIISTPLIGYFGGYYTYISFITAFGLRKVSPEAYLGPYYYFDTYKGAGRYANWSYNRKEQSIDNKLITTDHNGRYKYGGIVRFVIFGNKTKFLLNRETDPEDDSKISTDLASKVPFIKSTMKIRDVAGKWADDYDTVYVGSTKIKSEKYDDRVLNIQYAVKDYNQHLPITYHYVDTNQFANIKDADQRRDIPFNYKDYNIA